jgi:uncharacterized ferritin-like protein (DUF455 family)
MISRYRYLEERSMEALAAWLVAAAPTEVKIEFGLLLYEDAVRADAWRRRADELHSALPSFGWTPRPLRLDALELFCNEVANAPDLSLQMAGLFGVLKPWLLRQYEDHLGRTNPIYDGPTCKILEAAIGEVGRHIAWGRAALAALAGDAAAAPGTPAPYAEEEEARRARWITHLGAVLDWATHVVYSDPPVLERPEPPARFVSDPPVRDPAMRVMPFSVAGAAAPGTPSPYRIEPPPLEEIQVQCLMLLQIMCGELEAEELIGRVLVDFPELPWELRLGLARQLWDEARHCEAQWRRLESIGGTLGTYPVVLYFSEWVWTERDPLKRLLVLQRVVEGVAGDLHRARALDLIKRGQHHMVPIFDYVLADEDLHIGLSRWINILTADAPERQEELQAYQRAMEQTIDRYFAWAAAQRPDVQRTGVTAQGARR